jgi:hypothetical protein
MIKTKTPDFNPITLRTFVAPALPLPFFLISKPCNLLRMSPPFIEPIKYDDKIMIPRNNIRPN